MGNGELNGLLSPFCLLLSAFHRSFHVEVGNAADGDDADFNGNLLGEFNYRDKLGVLNAFDVAFISTGPQAGAFSLVDTDSSELKLTKGANSEQ